MYDMGLARFFFLDSLKKGQFFEEKFFLPKTSMEMVLEILFLAFSNVDIKFNAKKPNWRKDTILKIMPIAKKIEQIDKHKFIEGNFDKVLQIFIVYMTVLEVWVAIMTIYPTGKTLLATLE